MPASSDLIIKFLTSVLADSKAIEMTDLIMEHFELALNLVEDCIVSKRQDNSWNESGEENNGGQVLILLDETLKRCNEQFPELVLKVWRIYVKYIKQFNDCMAVKIITDLWRRVIHYCEDELYFQKRNLNEQAPGDEATTDDQFNSWKLLNFFAQRLSASVFYFAQASSCQKLTTHSIFLLCSCHATLEMKSPEGMCLNDVENLKQKSAETFHKAFYSCSDIASDYSAAKFRYQIFLSSIRNIHDIFNYSSQCQEHFDGFDILFGALLLVDCELEALKTAFQRHAEEGIRDILSCFIICIDIYATILAHFSVYYCGHHYLSDEQYCFYLLRFVSNISSSADIVDPRSFGIIMGTVVKRSLFGGERNSVVQRSVSVVYSYSLCIFLASNSCSMHLSIIEMLWSCFDSMFLSVNNSISFDSSACLFALESLWRTVKVCDHYRSSSSNGDDSSVSDLIVQKLSPFLCVHEDCSHRGELFCTCNLASNSGNSRRIQAIELILQSMPLKYLILAYGKHDSGRLIQRCVNIAESDSLTRKSVGLSLSLITSLLHEHNLKDTSLTSLKDSFVKNVAIGTNLVRWINILCDQVRNTITTNSIINIYKIQRLRNIIEIVGRLVKLLKLRKIPSAVQSILFGGAFSVLSCLDAAVAICKQEGKEGCCEASEESKRGFTEGGKGRCEEGSREREFLRAANATSLTCAGTISSILRIVFEGGTSSLQESAAENYMKLLNGLLRVTGVAPIQLAWRLLLIVMDLVDGSRALFFEECKKRSIRRIATDGKQQINLELILTICAERESMESNAFDEEYPGSPDFICTLCNGLKSLGE